MSIEKFRDGPGGTTFFCGPRIGGAVMATGFESKPAGQEIAARAEQRMREKQIDYLSALREIAAEDPELYEISNAEVLHDNCGRQYAAERGSGANFGEPVRGREVVPGIFVNRPNSWALHKMVYARAVERKIPYSQAKREIETEEPGLAEAAAGEGGMQIKDIKALPGGLQMIVCSTELGRTADPNRLFAEVVSKRARRKSIGYGHALAEVRRDYPKLAAASDAQVMGSRDR